MHGRLKPLVLAGGLAAVLITAAAAQVVHHPDPSAALEARWKWALETGGSRGGSDGFWVGYAIRRMMDEFTYMGSTGTYVFTSSRPSVHWMRGRPLGRILYGKDFGPEPAGGEEQVKEAARDALRDMEGRPRPRRRVPRDLALLLHIGRDGTAVPDRIRFSNMEVPFDPQGDPLIWLDRAGDDDSLRLLSDFFRRMSTEKEKKRMITAIALHDASAIVVPFLESILKRRDSDEIRGRAAVELGEHDTERSLELLRAAAGSDRSLLVRKKAVSGLEDLRRPGAADALIELARAADHRDIRKRAISALGDIASRKAVDALEGMVYGGDDVEVQKRAVYALEDLPGNQGVPYLIRIARTHSNLKVRKAAIYSLGDSDDPRALDALIDLIHRR